MRPTQFFSASLLLAIFDNVFGDSPRNNLHLREIGEPVVLVCSDLDYSVVQCHWENPRKRLVTCNHGNSCHGDCDAESGCEYELEHPFLTNNCDLKIARVTQKDLGKWICLPRAESQLSPPVISYVLPRFVQIDSHPYSPTELEEGVSTNFSCSYSYGGDFVLTGEIQDESFSKLKIIKPNYTDRRAHHVVSYFTYTAVSQDSGHYFACRPQFAEHPQFGNNIFSRELINVLWAPRVLDRGDGGNNAVINFVPGKRLELNISANPVPHEIRLEEGQKRLPIKTLPLQLRLEPQTYLVRLDVPSGAGKHLELVISNSVGTLRQTLMDESLSAYGLPRVELYQPQDESLVTANTDVVYKCQFTSIDWIPDDFVWILENGQMRPPTILNNAKFDVVSEVLADGTCVNRGTSHLKFQPSGEDNGSNLICQVTIKYGEHLAQTLSSMITIYLNSPDRFPVKVWVAISIAVGFTCMFAVVALALLWRRQRSSLSGTKKHDSLETFKLQPEESYLIENV